MADTTTMSLKNYPQMLRQFQTCEKHGTVEHFLRWIEDRGLVLARYDEDWDAFLRDYTSEARLLAEYLGTDCDQLLVERARWHAEARAQLEAAALTKATSIKASWAESEEIAVVDVVVERVVVEQQRARPIEEI